MHKKAHLLVLIVLLLLGSAAYAEETVVVANNSVKNSEISANDLREVFSGEKTSLPGGVRVSPVTLRGGAAHEAFLRAYIGKSDPAFRAAWRSLVFTGQASMPKTFDTEAALLDYVAATPGAIGYVSKGASRDKVKTLVVR
jgi:ABC-type phosphate transport system substrate-binding protein